MIQSYQKSNRFPPVSSGGRMVTSHASSIDTGCSCPVSSHCPVSMIAPGILALHLVSPHCTGYHCIRYSCLHDHDHRYRVQLSGIQSWIARAAASPSNFDVPNPVASSARKPPFRKHFATASQLWRKSYATLAQSSAFVAASQRIIRNCAGPQSQPPCSRFESWAQR